jgi:ribosomal protein S18 acetylase RimI-like enzyme
MPKVRRRGVPRALLEHLWLRVEEREISLTQLDLFATWLENEPEVPAAKWFKRFPEMTVCGEGEWVKTLLRVGQLPEGEEIV